MRIFLTGASGYVGAAVLDALVKHGHTVTALVRDSEKAARVAARGGRPVIGNLAEPDSYRAAADAQDGYVHTALDRAPGRGPTTDRIALDTLIAAARRPRTAGAQTPATRFVIYTSGTWVLGRASEPVGEEAPLNPIALAAWRVRMGTDEAKATYRLRAATIECVNAQAHNGGLVQLLVRGLKKVKAIALWFAATHNMARAFSLLPQAFT